MSGPLLLNDSSIHLMLVTSQTFSLAQKENLLDRIKSSLLKLTESNETLKGYLNSSLRSQQFTNDLNLDDEHKISISDSNFQLDILIDPFSKTFRHTFHSFVKSSYKSKCLILSGLEFGMNGGDLLLKDSAFTYEDFHLMLSDEKEHLKANEESVQVHLALGSKLVDLNKSWSHGLDKVAKNVHVVSLNFDELKVSHSTDNSLDSFVHELRRFYNEKEIKYLMNVSEFTGTLKINRPCLYIFPAKEGDAAYFHVNGYSMLVNGGYDRLRPCFWRFLNVLEQVDSILITHNDPDALGGLSSFFDKKAAQPSIKPHVLTVLGNLVASTSHSQQKTAQLAANLIANETASSSGGSHVDIICETIEKLKIRLLPLIKTTENLLVPGKSTTTSKYEHINLYSKLGYGSLDLYVLSPYVNGKDFKDFVAQQQNYFGKHLSQAHKSQLSVKNVFKNMPLSHLNSAVVLLVWLPSYTAHTDNALDNQALRLLFTGNAPQHVVFSALEKLKDFDILSQATYKVKASSAQTSHETSFANVVSTVKKSSSTAAQSANGHAAKPTAAADAKPATTAKPVSSRPSTGAANATASSTAPAKEKPATAAKETKPPAATASTKPPTTSKTTTAAAAKPPTAASKESTTKPTSASSTTAASKDETTKSHSRPSQVTKAPTSKPKETRTSTSGPGEQSANGAHEKTTTTRQSLSTKPAAAATTKTETTKSTTAAAAPKPAASKPAPAASAAPPRKPSLPSKNDAKKDEVKKEEKDMSKIITKRHPPVVKDAAEPLNTSSSAPKVEEVTKVENEKPLIDVSEVKTEACFAPVVDHVAEPIIIQQFESTENREPKESSVFSTIESSATINNSSSAPIDSNNWPNLSPVKRDMSQQNGNELAAELNVDLSADPNNLSQNNDSQLLNDGDDDDNEVAAHNTNGNEHQNGGSGGQEKIVNEEEEDLNKTHELPLDSNDEETNEHENNKSGSEEEVKSVIEFDALSQQTTTTTATTTMGTEDLISSLKQMNLQNLSINEHHSNGNGNGNGNGHHHHHHENEEANGNDVFGLGLDNNHQMIQPVETGITNSSNDDPSKWNLLDLPKPVNPATANDHEAKPAAADAKPSTTAAETKQSTTTSAANGKRQPTSSASAGEGVNKVSTKTSATTVTANKQPKHAPVYVEVTYIPAHGNSFYVDSDFFRRIRAKYYVLSTEEPSEQLLNSIIEGKESWEDHSAHLSIIPTYESETLRSWYTSHQSKLDELNIDIMPSASLATLTMDNPELSFQVYKLEF